MPTAVTSTRSAASSGVRGVIQRHPDKPFIEIQRFFKVAAQWVQYGPNGHMPESVANASQDAILHQINQEFPVSRRGSVVAPSKADLEQQCAVAMRHLAWADVKQQCHGGSISPRTRASMLHLRAQL